MKADNDQIALQGIEFWSTVCDEETDLAIEAMEVCVYIFNNIILEYVFTHTACMYLGESEMVRCMQV